ncbi:hypothetical protein [Phenylobacterium sp. J367]|uniref:hypothetical protein n=1 Tax=Phenylobacterium sp. J367 TaxID=2898435 RepID=UPI002150B3E9|nr:hypothetical protein [Phenylobacterium sp. J367]MCR5879427.1 hypothetical protein [Phenylobacterium sp. J367]
MDSKRRNEERTSPGKSIAAGALEAQQRILDIGLDRAKKHAPKVVKGIKAARFWGPARVLDCASIATAENKGRAIAEAAGGAAGSWIAGIGGGPAAVITAPIGGAAGAWAGGELYDAGEEIVSDILDWRDVNARKVAETRRINDRRNAEQRRNGR